MSELFGAGGPVTVEEQMKAAIEKANGSVDEPIFPDVTTPGTQQMTPAQQRMAHARAAKVEKNA